MDMLYPLRRLHGLLAEGPDWLKKKHHIRQQLAETFRENPRTVFLVMTPEHGNLGDHAIAVSAGQILEEMNVRVLEIPHSGLHSLYMQNLLSSLNGYPILINGGGNIGTLWPEAETMMEQIVCKNPRSPVVILPNTACFDPSDQGQQALQQALQIFGKHKNLHIYLREKVSYDLLKDRLPHVKLMPDLVMRFPWEKEACSRRGCLLCLRSDCEKTLTPEAQQKIEEEAELLFPGRVSRKDTVLEGEHIPISRHLQQVNGLLEAFSQAELVITDRLHGMIFAAITATPCIVLDSRSPKVRGCYQWLSHLPYVKFLEGRPFKQVYEAVRGENHVYDSAPLDPYYDALKEDLERICFRTGL